MLCFDYRGKSNPTIVHWDHEIAYLNPEQGLFPVCHSFTELLERLYHNA
jgi:hypothetical protein